MIENDPCLHLPNLTCSMLIIEFIFTVDQMTKSKTLRVRTLQRIITNSEVSLQLLFCFHGLQPYLWCSSEALVILISQWVNSIVFGKK